MSLFYCSLYSFLFDLKSNFFPGFTKLTRIENVMRFMSQEIVH